VGGAVYSGVKDCDRVVPRVSVSNVPKFETFSLSECAPATSERFKKISNPSWYGLVTPNKDKKKDVRDVLCHSASFR